MRLIRLVHYADGPRTSQRHEHRHARPNQDVYLSQARRLMNRGTVPPKLAVVRRDREPRGQ